MFYIINSYYEILENKNIPFQIYLTVSWRTLCYLIYDAPIK